MLNNLSRILGVSIFMVNTMVAQSNWVSTCGNDAPTLSQIMVDPCGSEITNEYIIFKTSSTEYDIRNLRVRVFNPQNNVLAGAINSYYRASNSITQAVVTQLNRNYPCAISPIFLEGAAAPFNGLIPPNSTILAFNNVPDVATLTENVASIAQACGSRVYVVFGATTVSLFYNNQPVSCPNGCIRRIYIDHAGQSDTSNFCSKYTYDASLLPRPPNTGSNPPNGYGSGSYIRPLANGAMGYGGGYLNRNNCFPDSALACIPPTLPSYGKQVWHVLGFAAPNNFTNEKFKGYYVARGNHSVSTPPGGGTLGSFEFNPALDGWGVLNSPSDAHKAGGALQSWRGCTIAHDTFSIQAKRQGFPCGYYFIKVQNYDDNLRLRIDQKGDGTVVKEINNPTKGMDVWQGYLGDSSKIDIYAADDSAQFISHIIFHKNESEHPQLDVQKGFIQNLKCFKDNSGKISTNTKGGLTPYTYSWASPTPIVGNNSNPTNLAAGTYAVTVFDNTGCQDTLKNLVVTQPLPVVANAGRDIKVCGNTVVNPLLGGNPTGLGGSGTLRYVWQPSTNLNDSTIANPSLIIPPSVSGNIIVSVTDDSACVAKDTLLVAVFTKNIIQRDTFVCQSLAVDTLIYKHTNVNGCDSTEFVKVKLLKSDTTFLPILSRCNPTDTATQIKKLNNMNGCDSVVIQQFVLSNADTVRRDSFICNTLTINKLSYIHKNRFGCDSVEIVSLKLSKSDTTFLPILSRCNPTDTATQIKKLNNMNGCDSIVIQRFVLSNADTARRDSFICNILTINELSYTYKNRFGCDSVEIVSLKLSKNDTTFLPILSRCNPTDTATQIKKLNNMNGCDSIVIQRFVLSNADTVRRDSFICNTLTINKLSYIHKNRFGCDSVEIVELKRLRQDTTILTPLSRCDARDTVSQIRYLTNSVGCDSIVIQSFLLAVKDTTVFNLTSCNERDTGTIYTVLVNRFGCENLVVRRTQLVPSGIKTQLSIEKRLICSDDNTAEIALKMLEGGKPPYLINWSRGDTTRRLSSLKAGNYQVSVTDARGCTLRDSIIIAAPPPLSITTQIQSPRCFEEKNGSFMIEKIDGGIPPYSIQFDNINVQNVRFPFSQKNLPANTYHFAVSDNNGCQIKDSFNLKENPKRSVSFNENPLELTLGDSITLSPQFNFTPQTWKWTPQYLFTCQTCLFPVVKPQSSITYKLIAIDENGCETAGYLSVKVKKNRNVFPPNSFSPNGDGFNDRFTIFTDATVERVKILEIYNRWGSKVFENRNFLPNDENTGWDGTFKGQKAESAVYVYYFTVIYKDGSEEVIQGEVSLVQ